MIEVESNDAAKDIFFENVVGAITYNELFLYGNINSGPINHTDIKKIYVTKKRTTTWNYFFLVTFLIGLYFALTSISPFFSVQFIVYNVICFLSLFISIKLELIRYKLCIHKKEDFIKVKIKKENKSAAKLLAYKMTKVKFYGFIS